MLHRRELKLLDWKGPTQHVEDGERLRLECPIHDCAVKTLEGLRAASRYIAVGGKESQCLEMPLETDWQCLTCGALIL